MSADGVLVATSFLNEAAWSAVVVLVRDSTPTNRAEAAIALRFVEPLTVSPTSGLFVVTPDYAGGGGVVDGERRVGGRTGLRGRRGMRL